MTNVRRGSEGVERTTRAFLEALATDDRLMETAALSKEMMHAAHGIERPDTRS